ncbi:membrane protein insertase YidC [Clostridium sp. MCC353]|uniref:membrane protein insertase YidC n=1 Tax=Clostridium sp. MCC353 TaxID=2592646 RepID=UPI00207A4EA4|nr:membrane protein insertase YidC [Clostridium sp. MCC353]MBT9775400.1 membrane protein insertase YidC [Clostridium sp. MCC353]
MDFLVLTKTGGFLLGPIANVLGVIMDALFRFTSIFGVMNIGLCIILFTIVIKLIMFPLTLKQQKSSKLMAVMQPEIQAIQKKYKGKNDQDSMMKMNVETKAVYEKYGTSMTGGCLQLIIQMPILFALYRVIYNIPAYVESVKMYFGQVVTAISGVDSLSNLAEGAATNLVNFANANNIPLTGMNAIGDLTGVTGDALGNKMIDILYKLNPAQWVALANDPTFHSAADVINTNAAQIESMNSFLGINLATSPWTGFVPTLAWLIPVLAGLTQWYSTKLMTSTQTMSEDTPGAQSMKTMNTMMPLMSAFFCFTFPAAIGIYWVASSAVQVVQQLAVNSYLNKVDMDEMIAKNVEKANKKRAKQGLPPAKVAQNATANLKTLQAQAEKEEAERMKKIEKTQEIVKESTNYYNQNAKPGSLAAKANMVQKYNEKHNK